MSATYQRLHAPLRPLAEGACGHARLEREGRSVTLTVCASGLRVPIATLYACAPGREPWRVCDASVTRSGTLTLTCDPFQTGGSLLSADTPLSAVLLTAAGPRGEWLLLGAFPGADYARSREAFWRALHAEARQRSGPSAPEPGTPCAAAPPAEPTAPSAAAPPRRVAESPAASSEPTAKQAAEQAARVSRATAPPAESPVPSAAAPPRRASEVPAAPNEPTAKQAAEQAARIARATAPPAPSVAEAPAASCEPPAKPPAPSVAAPPLRTSVRLARKRWRAPREAAYPAIEPAVYVPAELPRPPQPAPPEAAPPQAIPPDAPALPEPCPPEAAPPDAPALPEPRPPEEAPPQAMPPGAPALPEPLPPEETPDEACTILLAAMPSSLPASLPAQEPISARPVLPRGGRPVDALRPVLWPESVEPLRKLFETHRPRSPFGERDWRYIRVPMACGGSDPYFWVGVQVREDRVVRVTYALSGAETSLPPRGAAGYRWRQGVRDGYWTLTREVR